MNGYRHITFVCIYIVFIHSVFFLWCIRSYFETHWSHRTGVYAVLLRVKMTILVLVLDANPGIWMTWGTLTDAHWSVFHWLKNSIDIVQVQYWFACTKGSVGVKSKIQYWFSIEYALIYLWKMWMQLFLNRIQFERVHGMIFSKNLLESRSKGEW